MLFVPRVSTWSQWRRGAVSSRSSSGWLVNFYFPRDFGLSTGGGWGAGHPTTWHYNQYQPGDYRRQAGYRTGGCRWDGYCVTALKDGPLPWKYRPTNNGSDGGSGDVDIPLYRYAETLLIYAEAQNELGNSGVAVQYLNMIRARARNGTGAEKRPDPADYVGPMDQRRGLESPERLRLVRPIKIPQGPCVEIELVLGFLVIPHDLRERDVFRHLSMLPGFPHESS